MLRFGCHTKSSAFPPLNTRVLLRNFDPAIDCRMPELGGKTRARKLAFDSLPWLFLQRVGIKGFHHISPSRGAVRHSRIASSVALKLEIKGALASNLLDPPRFAFVVQRSSSGSEKPSFSRTYPTRCLKTPTSSLSVSSITDLRLSASLAFIQAFRTLVDLRTTQELRVRQSESTRES